MSHGGNVWRSGEPGEWLDFSANLRPEGPPDWVREALRAGEASAGYYPDIDMRRARAGLARHLGVSEACVAPTAGGISAIDMAARLQARGAVLFSPCFSEYAPRLALAGVPVRTVSLLTRVADRMPADPAGRAEAALFPGCAVWLCNPMNPMGAAFTAEQVERLLTLVEGVDGWLIVDEAFIEYCPERSARSLLETHERLVLLGSMTKILGIPGVRLGYLCARPEALARMRAGRIPWELNCFAEAVARALPGHEAQMLADARANASRREWLRGALTNMGAFVYPSEAPFLLADFGRSVGGIVRRLEEKKILVRSCADFAGVDDGRHLRLAVKDEAANARLIKELWEAMECVESR